MRLILIPCESSAWLELPMQLNASNCKECIKHSKGMAVLRGGKSRTPFGKKVQLSDWD